MKLPSYTVSKYFVYPQFLSPNQPVNLRKIAEVSILSFLTVSKLQFEVLIGFEIVRLAEQLLNRNDREDCINVPSQLTVW
jgi:hypothetical protein